MRCNIIAMRNMQNVNKHRIPCMFTTGNLVLCKDNTKHSRNYNRAATKVSVLWTMPHCMQKVSSYESAAVVVDLFDITKRKRVHITDVRFIMLPKTEARQRSWEKQAPIEIEIIEKDAEKQKFLFMKFMNKLSATWDL